MLLALLLAQAVPGTILRPQAPPVEGETVVVIARDPRVSKAALEACIKRKCPPREDIALSIAAAEDQFLEGGYEDAWSLLRASRRRNDRHAGALPGEVSGLRQFAADMASVLGDPNMARVGTIDALSALKASGVTAAAALEMKRLEVGDAFVRQATEEAGVPVTLRSKLQMAIATYDAVAARAARLGLSDVRGRAMLRGASLYAQMSGGGGMYQGEANRRIAALRATTDPAMQRYRDAALLLEARMAYGRGDPAPMERLLAATTVRTRQPMLVAAPRMDLRLLARCGSGMRYDFKDQWIDYEFTVGRDGRVADPVERRRGRHADGRWIAEVERSLAGRRYLPLDLPETSPGLQRLERFVLVSDQAVATGTRLSGSCGAPTILTMDLTATEPRAPRGS